MKPRYFLIVWILTLVCINCQAELERANLEISFYKKNTQNGKFRQDSSAKELILAGYFSPAGPVKNVEGPIYQIHVQVCQKDETLSSYGDYHEGLGWLAYTKLESHAKDRYSCNVYERAQQAFDRGAMAMIFDVTDNNGDAERLVESKKTLSKPIIMIRGAAAEMFNTQVILQDFGATRDGPKEALGRILIKDGSSYSGNNNNFIKLMIFVAVFVVIVCVVTAILVYKWQCYRPHEISMEDHTKRLLRGMKTRRYQNEKSLYSLGAAPIRSNSILSGFSTDSTADSCAICLSTYKHEEELRVLPCMHEFHKSCVDQWLVKHRTCPLCLYNIIEPASPKCPTSQHRLSSHMTNSIPQSHSNGVISPSNRSRYNSNVPEHYVYERVPHSEQYSQYSQHSNAHMDDFNHSNQNGLAHVYRSDRQIYTSRRALPYVNTFIQSYTPNFAAHNTRLQSPLCHNNIGSTTRNAGTAFYPVTTSTHYPASMFSQTTDTTTNSRPPPQRCKRAIRKPARQLRDVRISLSSESDVEFAKSLRSSVARSMRSASTRAHLPDIKHHTDADVSETSGADLDSDGQCKLSDSSVGNTSNHSTFGSSKIATDSSGSSQEQSHGGFVDHCYVTEFVGPPPVPLLPKCLRNIHSSFADTPAFIPTLASCRNMPHDLLTYGSELPTYCSSVPTSTCTEPLTAYTTDLPAYSTHFPAYNPDLPAYNTDLPVYGTDLPVYSTQLPVYSKDSPVDCKNFTDNYLTRECRTKDSVLGSDTLFHTNLKTLDLSPQHFSQSLEHAPNMVCDVNKWNLPETNSGITHNAKFQNQMYSMPSTSSQHNMSHFAYNKMLSNCEKSKQHPTVDKLKCCTECTDSDTSLTSRETLGVSPIVSDFPVSANSESETSADNESFCKCVECACAKESIKNLSRKTARSQTLDNLDPTSIICTYALEKESLLKVNDSSATDCSETDNLLSNSPCMVKSLSDNNAFTYSTSFGNRRDSHALHKVDGRLKHTRRSAFRPYKAPTAGSVQNQNKSYYIASSGNDQLRSRGNNVSRDILSKSVWERYGTHIKSPLIAKQNVDLPEICCVPSTECSRETVDTIVDKPPPVPPRRTAASLSVNNGQVPTSLYRKLRTGGNFSKRNIHLNNTELVPAPSGLSHPWRDILFDCSDKVSRTARRNTIGSAQAPSSSSQVDSPTTSMVIFSEGGFVTLPVKEHREAC